MVPGVTGIPTLTVRLLLLPLTRLVYLVDEIYIHGGFLAEQSFLVIDVDLRVVPAITSKELARRSFNRR